ncbi:MBL fold metallo-hydrolase [Halobacteriovorax sp. HLS]|uniref:MBL fold metallo-hydrolase n=1 Tax=Halobacteriovorax sp. HLS TaxID=2234000 RepID=UPI0013E3C8C7|nr:MBL fold metallo-hydrolase [Halobacteriovorax sp. HLS]
MIKNYILLVSFYILGVSSFAFELPEVTGHLNISLSRLETGFNDSPEGLIFSGGSFGSTHRSTHSAFVVKHSSGNFLIDSGLGKNIDKQFEDFSWMFKPFFSYVKEVPAIESIKELSIDKIFITHLHWDHASGISDFPNAKVFTTAQEKEHAFSDVAKSGVGYLFNQYSSKLIRWGELKLEDKEYGPFRKSLDFFGDGSFIVVALPGHTPGSVGFILNLSQEQRFFFVGDSIWSVKQLNPVAEKFFISKKLVDERPETLLETIELISNISKKNKSLVVVPSHDYPHISKRIPVYPEFLGNKKGQ